jgi:acetolactate synthase-1/2/3 large subunit
VILVIDSDVPWIPLVNRPNAQASIHHIDIDPLKEQMPFAVMHRGHVYQADARTALRQINAAARSKGAPATLIAERYEHYVKCHASRRARLDDREKPHDDVISPEYLTACLRKRIGPETIVLSEGISNYPVISDHFRMTRPGSLFTSGGGSLGWSGGAAIGAKLALPQKTIINVVGDGSYMMSIPSSVHWMARRYRTPFLQVIYNNGGWKSPKLSTLAVHPDGYASRATDIGVSFDEAPDYAGIAASAGGAYARTVLHMGELDEAIQAALRAVEVEGRSAVLDVHLPRL